MLERTLRKYEFVVDNIGTYNKFSSAAWSEFERSLDERGVVNDYHANATATRRTEKIFSRLHEELLASIRYVGFIEKQMTVKGYKVPWTPESPQYTEALQFMFTRNFHRALDKVQQLVVQRLFELSKANIVGLGVNIELLYVIVVLICHRI